jgi:hypothetical protein
MALAIDAPGYDRVDTRADVKGGVVSHIKVELNKKLDTTVKNVPGDKKDDNKVPAGGEETEERPGKAARVLFWTSLVLTAGGVAAFTITGLQVKSIENEQDQAIADWGNGYKTSGVVQFPNDACAEARAVAYQKLIDICDRGQNMATVTNVLIGVTAVAAITTGYFLWKGYISPRSSSHESAKRKSGPTNLVVAPAFSKDGAGIGAIMQF